MTGYQIAAVAGLAAWFVTGVHARLLAYGCARLLGFASRFMLTCDEFDRILSIASSPPRMRIVMGEVDRICSECDLSWGLFAKVAAWPIYLVSVIWSAWTVLRWFATDPAERRYHDCGCPSYSREADAPHRSPLADYPEFRGPRG